MATVERTKEIEITRESEGEQMLQLDNRGRITIPSSVRTRHGIDPQDDSEIWVEISINRIEVRDQQEQDGGGDA